MVWKLFYDGGCNLCHVSKLRAERWAERAGQPMEVDILQSHYAIEQGYGDAMVLEADRVYQGAEAWMKIMTISPWYLRWLGWLGNYWPFRPMLKWGYGFVAKYRYKWFGTRACPIPGAKDRKVVTPEPESQVKDEKREVNDETPIDKETLSGR